MKIRCDFPVSRNAEIGLYSVEFQEDLLSKTGNEHCKAYITWDGGLHHTIWFYDRSEKPRDIVLTEEVFSKLKATFYSGDVVRSLSEVFQAKRRMVSITAYTMGSTISEYCVEIMDVKNPTRFAE